MPFHKFPRCALTKREIADAPPNSLSHDSASNGLDLVVSGVPASTALIALA
jgi:hypothetical protein